MSRQAITLKLLLLLLLLLQLVLVSLAKKMIVEAKLEPEVRFSSDFFSVCFDG